MDRKYWCHLIRKPFLSSLYGIYVGRGIIDTTNTLAEFGIDDIPGRGRAEGLGYSFSYSRV